ncbi:MAG TPA: DUF5320 domain-containing protein [Spirochaetia bacterium]|nr:DUF5320 domain-containing protein [Spirochaetia bacterium]
MPRGDGTGPTGMGAMTGRAAGNCTGSEISGYAHREFGGRFHAGFGQGICGRARHVGGSHFGAWLGKVEGVHHGNERKGNRRIGC